MLKIVGSDALEARIRGGAGVMHAAGFQKQVLWVPQTTKSIQVLTPC